MKTILIPTDFSDSARDALNYALELVGSKPAKIRLLHVVTPSVVQVETSGYPAGVLPTSIDEAQEKLKTLELDAKAYRKEKRAHFIISTNIIISKVIDGIQSEAEGIGADIIIMGTQGANYTSLEHKIGTISTAVIGHAPCPVLLVPNNYAFVGINNLLFATSLNHGDPYQLWRAIKLLYPHVEEVRCLHIVKEEVDKDSKVLQQFADFLVRQSPILQVFFDVKVDTDISLALIDYAEIHASEMIVMHRSKRSFWERLFESSHTKQMVPWLEVPLLVMDNEA